MLHCVLEVTNLDYSLGQHHKQLCKKSEPSDLTHTVMCKVKGSRNGLETLFNILSAFQSDFLFAFEKAERMKKSKKTFVIVRE